MTTACSRHDGRSTAPYAADMSEAEMTILTLMTTGALALMAATHFIALRVERHQRARPLPAHVNQPVIRDRDA